MILMARTVACSHMGTKTRSSKLDFVQNEGYPGASAPYCMMTDSTPTILQRGERCPLQHTLAPFQSLFSTPTWRKVQRLIIETLLARGRRTVTAALRHTGQGDTPAFSLYHQVFNRARWSALKGSCCLLALLVQTFDAAGGSLTFVLDETLERRWGRRINKRGDYRDPLASSRKRSVSTSGLRWIVLTLVLTPPWMTRCWALPVLSVPAPTPQSLPRENGDQ